MKDSTINYLFNLCVLALQELAALLGISYQAINVWIFCIIGPLCFMLITVLLIYQICLNRKIMRLYHKP